LSGGQEQRLALARAVYGPYQHLLLDDCLSSVDTHTAKHIVEHCLSGSLMQGHTCILVTHHVELCTPIAKFAVLMNAGRIVASGTPSVALASLLSTNNSNPYVNNTTSSSNVQIKYKKGNEGVHRVQETPSSGLSGVPANCTYVEQETYASGEIPIRLYKTYIRAAGYRFWIVSIGAYLLLQLLIIIQAYWLVTWTRSASPETNGYYIRGYLWYTLAIILF
jgi:ABC-type multidrug transport system ATPase subunit